VTVLPLFVGWHGIGLVRLSRKIWENWLFQHYK
jgi:hypothetical protein